MAYTWVVGDKLLLQLLPPWPLVVEHMPFHRHHLNRLNSDILAIFLLISPLYRNPLRLFSHQVTGGGQGAFLIAGGPAGHSSRLGIQSGGIMQPSAFVTGGQGTMASGGGGIGHQLAHVTPPFSSIKIFKFLQKPLRS